MNESTDPNAPTAQEVIGEVVLGEEIPGESANNGNGDNTDAPSPTQTPILPIDPDHAHSYVSAVTKEATCSEMGETTYTCDCGDTYTEEVIVPEVVASGTLAEGRIEWKIIGTTLYVNGEGAIPGFDESGAWFASFGNGYGNSYIKAWEMYYDVVEEIVLSEGITAIGKDNFAGFSKVTSLVFPSTLTSIGKYGMSGMGLTSLEIPKRITNIGSHAFGDLKFIFRKV